MPDFKRPFKRPSSPNEIWYDPEFDRILIEQSIAKQYGVLPSEQGNLKYSDWSKMVSGLMEDTPLGNVLQIRMEKDPKIYQKFTNAQKLIRADWASFKREKYAVKQDTVQKAELAVLQAAMSSMFSGRR